MVEPPNWKKPLYLNFLNERAVVIDPPPNQPRIEFLHLGLEWWVVVIIGVIFAQ